MVRLTDCPYLHDSDVDLGNMGTLGVGELNMADRYQWSTDNTGTPGHSVTGPNLYLTDLTNDRVRLVERSLGQLAVFLQDENLPNSGSTSHALQLHFASTGVHQTGSGFGTGIQVFMTDDLDVMSEAGNLQVVWANPVTHTSYVDIVARLAGAGALCGRFQWDGSIVAANTAGGNFQAPYLAASVNHGQVSFGNVLFDGATTDHFVGNGAGTGLAGAFTAAFTGNPIDIQVGSATCIKVNAAGNASIVTTNTNKIAGLTTPFTLNSVLVTFTTDANKTLSLGEYVNPYIDIQTDVVLTTQRNLVVPLGIGEFFVVRNRNAQAIQVIGSSGTGTVVASGKIAILCGSGSNVIRCTPDTTP